MKLLYANNLVRNLAGIHFAIFTLQNMFVFQPSDVRQGSLDSEATGLNKLARVLIVTFYCVTPLTFRVRQVTWSVLAADPCTLTDVRYQASFGKQTSALSSFQLHVVKRSVFLADHVVFRSPDFVGCSRRLPCWLNVCFSKIFHACFLGAAEHCKAISFDERDHRVYCRVLNGSRSTEIAAKAIHSVTDALYDIRQVTLWTQTTFLNTQLHIAHVWKLRNVSSSHTAV